MTDKLNSNDSPQSPRRREILTAGSAGAVALALGGRAARARDTAAEGGEAVSVAADGNYERVPLRKDTVRVTAVQSIMRAVRDTANPAREMKANLNHMLDLIDKANGFPGPPGPHLLPRAADHGLEPVDPRTGPARRNRNTRPGDRGAGQESEGIRLLHHLRHLCERPGLAGPSAAERRF